MPKSKKTPNKKIDLAKRKFLLNATRFMGVLGLAAAAAPFAASMLPTRAAEAAGGPVEISIAGMKPGDQLTVVWRGKPVWIIRRDLAMIASLDKVTDELRDPLSKVDQQPPYAQNEYRSRKKEFLILVGVCTHLGCTPTYRPEPESVDKKWQGGFYCTCHGSKFDLAGRVFKGVPAPINMEVPPYVFLDDEKILIGKDSQ